jgi:L-threonylcarbamoyladenylate synthase
MDSGTQAIAETARVRPCDAEALDEAARLLRAGELVVFPTETVYGVGADATNARAVARIFEAKGRPRFNPLIAHVPDLEAAEGLAKFPEAARLLAERFWPGPLTLVLERRLDCPVALLACAGLDTIAVRVPAHPAARELLRASGRPVVAPSANRSGRISPTKAAHAAEELGERVALVLDGGPCGVGVESTIVRIVGDRAELLRPGGIARAMIEAIAGPLAAPQADEARPASPGRLASHYAPRLPVRLEARDVRPGEALLAFGADAPEGAAETLNLSPAGDPVEAAANLFAMLRALDRPGRAGIAVMPIPDEDLGEAINDRLRRAAAPRPEALP